MDIVSGSETDVCVLATVLDAVDMGYRVTSPAMPYSLVRGRAPYADAALSH